MRNKNNLTLTEINELFYEKDGKLYWKKNVGKRGKKDSLVGCFNDRGYQQVKYRTKQYKCHRILYQIYNNLEEIPENLVIDHIDKNCGNNSKENLRLCTISENLYNTKMYKNNKLGIKNVHIKNSNYIVQIIKDKKIYSTKFPLTENGLENAIVWRDKMLQELHGEFSSKG